MYDDIANVYHLIYEDWDAAIDRQGTALDELFCDLADAPLSSVLDVSCGIGTQALGLAARGYKVTASDLSTGAINRARREAASRQLEIAFSVADMCQCADVHPERFDVVLCADNSLPHLPNPTQVRVALNGFFHCLRPGGVAVVGIREYLPTDDRTTPQVQPYGFRELGDDRYFVFQTRDWQDDRYRVAMYFVREARVDRPAEVTAGVSTYYVISIDEVLSLFTAIGFEDVRRIDEVMHQPIIIGRRPKR